MNGSFKNVSNDFKKRNPHLFPCDTGETAIVERGSSHESLAEGGIQREAGPRFLVRVTSIRKRLADEDGLCEKYYVDLLRYSGVIPDDSPGICAIETCQRKAQKGEEERTILEVFALEHEQV